MGTAFEGPRERGMGAFEGDARPPAPGATPGAVNAWTTGRHPKRTRRVLARGWQRLRLRRRIALALASVAFAATLLLAVLADVGTAGGATAHSHTPPVLGALLVGLLLTGGFMLAAMRIAGPLSPAALAALYASLDDALDSARQVDGGLRAQLTRTTQQSATARHLMDEIRTLTDVANALEHGVALLRDSTGQLYTAGAPTPEARAQTARVVAVAASQIGGAAEQATALCQRLRVFTNQVIAETHTLGENGQQAAHHAASVAAALRRIESALSMVGTSSSGGLRAMDAVQGALARVAAPPRGAHLAPAEAPAPPAAAQPTTPRASLRAPVPPRRSAWQHTGRTVPRLGRSGRPMTHPHLQGGDALGTSGYRAGSGGPRPGGNHPSTARHIQRPWYTDEPAAGADDDQPTRPESAMHPTPRPDTGDWPRE
ncbi:MAG TPA: hypothetical protein VID73_01215 [Ktedonobacterales bacterium]|jgi:hypothetical protein